MLMIQIDGGGKRTGGGNFPEKDSQKLEKQKKRVDPRAELIT
jgi:hypothetical protein